MLSNQRPQIVDEADRWEKLVEAGFRDLGLERLVHAGMEQKAKLVRAIMRKRSRCECAATAINCNLIP
jgi:hypothetical protein